MILMLVFVTSLAVTVGVVLLTTRETSSEKTVKSRVAEIVKPVSRGGVKAIELATREESALSDLLGGVIKDFKFSASLEALIVHSGSDTTVGNILLTGAGIGLVAGLVVHHFFGILLVTLPVAAVGTLIPYFWLRFKLGRRLKKFNEALPDAIDLMARALRAGHSMSSAIEVVAEQSPKVLGDEFAQCFQEQKFGIPFREALIAMGERVPCEDLHFLITAILVQKETGGDLTDILDRTTLLIRERVRIEGEVRTHTAQGRLTGWILALMPVGMLFLMNLLNPGYSDVLFHDPLGHKLLGTGGVLIVIGGLIIRKIVDIKV